MTKKLKKLWEDLNIPIMVNQRELVLGVLLCAFVGILIGILFSPKKRVMVGCHNGSNNVDNGNLKEMSPKDTPIEEN